MTTTKKIKPIENSEIGCVNNMILFFNVINVFPFVDLTFFVARYNCTAHIPYTPFNIEYNLIYALDICFSSSVA